MLSNVPAMLDCVEARIQIDFTDGDRHTEIIELDDDSMDVVCEIDRLLGIYVQEGVEQNYTHDEWIERAREPGRVYFGFPEYVLAAAETLEAIFDTYVAGSPTTVQSFQTVLVDHQGNIMPLDIERI